MSWWTRVRRSPTWEAEQADPQELGPYRLDPFERTPTIDSVAWSIAAARIYGAALAAAVPDGGPLTPRLLYDCGYRLARFGRWCALIEIADDGAVFLTAFDGWANEGRWQGSTREDAGRSPRTVDAPDAAVFHVALPGGPPTGRQSSAGEIATELERGMATEAAIVPSRIIALELAAHAAGGTEARATFSRSLLRGGFLTMLGVRGATPGKVGPDPSDTAVKLREQLRTDFEAMTGLIGLMTSQDSTAKRELWRLAVTATFEPLARLIEAEAAEKLDVPLKLNTDAWTRRDLETSRAQTQRATAVQRLVTAGVEVAEARAAIGI